MLKRNCRIHESDHRQAEQRLRGIRIGPGLEKRIGRARLAVHDGDHERRMPPRIPILLEKFLRDFRAFS